MHLLVLLRYVEFVVVDFVVVFLLMVVLVLFWLWFGVGGWLVG